MKKSGVTLDDLKGAAGKPAKAAGRSARKSASKGTTVPPKYRNPATGDTWTGRGRTPVWMAEAERAGATRASFLIAPAS
jgi:DNA-binding protein H-NS